LVLGVLFVPRTVVEPTVSVVATYKFENVVGGLDWTKGWGLFLGFREAGETVAVDLTAVHEVFVCLARLQKIELDIKYLMNKLELYSLKEIDAFIARVKSGEIPVGTPLPLQSAECEEERLLKTGKVTFTIPCPGSYVLVVGKAAGYVASSFLLDVTVTKTTLTTRTL